MREILKPRQIARISGETPNAIRWQMRNKIVPYGRVVKGSGNSLIFYANINEVADFYGLSRNEVIKRAYGEEDEE